MPTNVNVCACVVCLSNPAFTWPNTVNTQTCSCMRSRVNNIATRDNSSKDKVLHRCSSPHPKTRWRPTSSTDAVVEAAARATRCAKQVSSSPFLGRTLADVTVHWSTADSSAEKQPGHIDPTKANTLICAARRAGPCP